MFSNLLEKKNEKTIFAKLCLIVAIADGGGEESEDMKELRQLDNHYFVNLFGGSIYSYDLVPERSQNTIKMFSEFFEYHSINIQEAQLLEQIFDDKNIDRDVIVSIFNKVVEINRYLKDDHEKLFSALISEMVEKDISTRSKKILLFEMCNMAFKDGNCSNKEKAVIRIAGNHFELDSETIEEILQESEKFNKTYNNCMEIIFE